MQVNLPINLRKEIDSIYKKYKNSGEVNLPRFINHTLRKRVKIKLILTRNKELADQLKEKAIEQFNS